MKKLSILCLAMALVFGAQAQFGNLGKSIQRSVEKKVEKKAMQKADQEIDKALDKAFGLDKSQQQKSESKSDVQRETPSADIEDGKLPTPEDVMASVPALPSYQNIAEYLCEQNRENPRPLKLMTNPTTAFLTNMAIAAASGYVVMMSKPGSGSLYYYDKELLEELGINPEEFDKMSDKEKEELSRKYATEIQERYIRTAEVLANDDGYTERQNKYDAIEKEIEALYDKAESQCKEIWEKTSGSKASASEKEVCSYYNEAVPIYYKAVTEAMKIRKSRQLSIAKEIDEYVQKLAEQHRGEVYAGFYNQGGLCATSYVGDAARLMSIPDPR